ncbi:peptidase c14 caspase catalytic subunit p20 [Colletotrichum kahawae]|uniref:Peptidase c14 caspase catalytic subunit p20 n=1 Tax=Colletotrichum kahawae TaxID=34407 RepID=A0AAE0D5H5_COLKA|nr:peptidase c14 caspase catalytic subunit p20 [Colletotrichum kahawae]
MAAAKRALLIGSPVGGLKGTENDLTTMSKLLQHHGFDVENPAYQLEQAGKLEDEHLETNSHAVRIAAAATDEIAWEYHKDGHNYMGQRIRGCFKSNVKTFGLRLYERLAVTRLNNDVALEDVVERLFDHAKEYGQAQSILSLRSGVDEELLGDEVDIVLGVENGGKKSVLARRSDSTFPLRGIPIQWPRSVPRNGYVEESFVFVITNEEVDLRDLDTSLKGYVRRGPEEAAARDSGIVHYDVEHVRYHLQPSSSS